LLGKPVIEADSKLLENPQEIYGRCGPKQRQLLNQAFFDEDLHLEDEVVTRSSVSPSMN